MHSCMSLMATITFHLLAQVVMSFAQGRESVKAVFLRNFRDATAKQFEWHWKDVIVNDNQAVVAITLTIHLDIGETAIEVPVRWTVVLKKENGRWVWLHRHAPPTSDSVSISDSNSSQIDATKRRTISWF